MDVSQSRKKQQNELSGKMPMKYSQRENIYFLTANEKELFCLHSHKKSSVSCSRNLKVAKSLEPKIFSDIFLLKEHKSFFKVPRNKTVCFENISY